MSINIKKYTKEQMAKMVMSAQDAQERAEANAATYFEGAKKLREQISKMETQERALRAKNAALTEQIDQLNGEAINKANEIANLKADADVLRNKLADTEAALGRANAEATCSVAEKNKLNAKIKQLDGEAINKANEIARLKEEISAWQSSAKGLQTKLHEWINMSENEHERANYAENHPWRNLWAWVKRKLKTA